MHDYYIRRQRSKFECSPAQSIDVVLRGSGFDGKVLPLDIAKVAQALPKVIPVRRVVYDTYARHPADWLLRLRDERPPRRRPATQERDELPPFEVEHGLPLGSLRTGCASLPHAQVAVEAHWPPHKTIRPELELSRNIDPQQHDEEKQCWIQHHSQSVQTPALIGSPLVHGAPLSIARRVSRALNLPDQDGQILGAGLKCSESRCCGATASIGSMSASGQTLPSRDFCGTAAHPR